jgi:O-antigen/teichoic acid export membrane protein
MMLLSRGVALGASFAISIMTARALGAAGKGELSLLLQVPALLVALLSMGIANSTTYCVGQHKRTVGQSFADSMLVVAIVSVIGLPAAIVSLHFIQSLAPVGNRTFGFASLLIPLSLVTLVLGALLTATGQVEKLAARQAEGAIAGLAVIALAYSTGRLSVRTAVLVSLIASVVSTMLLLWPLFRSLAETIVMPSISRIRETVVYSIKAHVSSLAGMLNRRQDVVLLGVLSSASAVGIYSVGVALSELLWNIPSSIGVPLIARSLQEDPERGAEVAAQAARVTLLVMVAITAVFALVIRPLISLVYTAGFANAAWVYLLLVPGTIVYGLGSVLLNYLVAHGSLYPRVALSVTVSNLVLNLALIPFLGMYGAALASSISYSGAGVYYTVAFLRSTDLGLASVLVPRASDVRAVWASLRAAVPRSS